MMIKILDKLLSKIKIQKKLKKNKLNWTKNFKNTYKEINLFFKNEILKNLRFGI